MYAEGIKNVTLYPYKYVEVKHVTRRYSLSKMNIILR